MLIEMKNITKRYGSLVANDNVSITLKKGEILAIVGENGAGKSTLMKILYGLESYDSGEILINGKTVRFSSPHDAIKNSIGMVQQHFMLFPPFSAAENIVYGNEPRKGVFFDKKEAYRLVEELCRKYNLYIDPKIKVKDCPVGLQQRIEILKVLFQQVDIIIFDEPSAVLAPQEIDNFLQTVLDLKKAGKSIILITHKLNEVMAVADYVTVMRNGKVVKKMPKYETSIEELSYLMVGHHLEEREIEEIEPEEEILAVSNLTKTSPDGVKLLDDVNISVRRGEIVGIAGVSGNGQSELIQCISGLEHADSGKIVLNGIDVTNASVSAIREAGCACIPEDRYYWGSAAEASLEENCIMYHYQRKSELMKNGFLNSRNVSLFSETILKDFDVKHTSSSQSMKDLSGGNAQKLIVGREYMQNTPLLIAAEPTRGIDIGAIEYIHGRLLEKRQKKDAILLISSELSEIIELSDRIYVMCSGRINGEFSRDEATREKIGYLMMGGKNDDEM